MEFITKEVQTELGLTPEQIEKITPLYNTHIETVKGEFSELANKNAEGILTGVVAPVEKATGIKRADGEKVADYLTRSSTEHFRAKQTELDQIKADYEAKIKGVTGNDALKTEYEAMQTKLNGVLEKYADYDKLKEVADKYQPLEESHNLMKLEVSFGSVRPNFPESANPYEVDAKWNKMKQDILKTWNIDYIDGKAIAIDKENPNKREELKTLVEKNTDIAGLLNVHDPKGSGSNPKDLTKIEGVPFEVPSDLKEQMSAVDAQCVKEGLKLGTDPYSSRYKELFEKIKQKTATK